MPRKNTYNAEKISLPPWGGEDFSAFSFELYATRSLNPGNESVFQFARAGAKRRKKCRTRNEMCAR